MPCDALRAADDRDGRHGSADLGRTVGLGEIDRPVSPYKKTETLLLGLMPARSVRGSLFLRPQDRRRVALMLVIEAINRQHERDRLQFVGTGLE